MGRVDPREREIQIKSCRMKHKSRRKYKIRITLGEGGATTDENSLTLNPEFGLEVSATFLMGETA